MRFCSRKTCVSAAAKAAEYYLCGPPMMIKACNKMLYDLVVPANHITYDEF
jgi:Na+-transporting NADH:ubiquinone oxidoreductase subunit F